MHGTSLLGDSRIDRWELDCLTSADNEITWRTGGMPNNRTFMVHLAHPGRGLTLASLHGQPSRNLLDRIVSRQGQAGDPDTHELIM